MFASASWPPSNAVGSVITTRQCNGVSQAPFNCFNLAYHVGDEPAHVTENRRRLAEVLPSEPIWLNQVHGSVVVEVTSDNHAELRTDVLSADGLYSKVQNIPLAIMTADCLPIFFRSKDGQEIAALHGGWRPLNNNIIANALALFTAQSSDIEAWLGPAIGPRQFEVGQDVYDAFITQCPGLVDAFVPHPVNPSKWLANIYAIAKTLLSQLGVKDIYCDDECTVENVQRYYSYRREGQTGRMAFVIWRK